VADTLDAPLDIVASTTGMPDTPEDAIGAVGPLPSIRLGERRGSDGVSGERRPIPETRFL